MSLLDVLESMPEPEAEQEQIPASDPTPTESNANASGSGSGSKTTNNDDPEARAEVIEMQNQAPLLKLIQEDTGENGRKSGSTVYFKKCPVCGHTDCFRYYASSNTWACFGGSNPNANANGREVGAYLAYLIRVHNMTPTEAMRRLREVTNHPYEERAGKTKGANANSGSDAKNTENNAVLLLPPIRKTNFVDPPRRAKVQVEGMWRRGDLVELVAKKKSAKSWDAFLLAAAVANGGEWFGHRCERGNVLIIDPELPRAALDNRLRGLCLLNGYDPGFTQEHVTMWALRGVSVGRESASIEHVAHDLETYIASGIYSAETYSLIIIDSSSALLGSRDENSAGDVRAFANVCLEIAQTTSATVMLVLHEGKAKSGDRDPDDRARGSSVWGDVADCQMSLCRLYPPTEEDAELLGRGRAYQLECAAARDFAEFETIRFITAFEEADKERHIWAPSIAVPEGDALSTWTLKDELAERKKESEGGKNSGKLKAALAAADAMTAQAAILNHFYHNGITDPLALSTTQAADIAARALERESVQTKVLKTWLEDSPWLTVYVKSPRRQYVCPIHLAPSDGADATASEDQADTLL